MLLEQEENDGSCKKDKMINEITEMVEETNNNDTSDNFDEGERFGTPIQEFYAGQKILITGGTGFLGKVLIEKLLRSCPHIACLYLLVRPKKDKTAHARTEEIFRDRLFDRLNKEIPKYRDKVITIHGDCSLKGLGLSEADRETLIKEVSIVFHVAATVRFNEKFKLAIAINVRSTNDIIDICKSMRKLKSLVHVSTAYANCHENHIGERFYKHSTNYKDFIDLIEESTEDELEDKFQTIKDKWPNTYTFTKAMAERLIRDKCEDLPIGIFRPAIVISTAFEPLQGWVDNIYAATGMVAAIASGFLRVVHFNLNMLANIVPVDVTVNGMIASAWDIYKHKRRKADDMLIYNFVSTADAPLTWREFSYINYPYISEYPLSNSVWYPFYFAAIYKLQFTIFDVILHTIPAIFVDIALLCLGHKPRMLKTHGKINKFINIIAYFSFQDWTYDNDNVHNMWRRLHSKDRQLFRFSMVNFDWKTYFQNYFKGIRIHVFKESLDNLDSCRIRHRRLYWAHQCLKTLVLAGSTWALWSILRRILY